MLEVASVKTFIIVVLALAGCATTTPAVTAAAPDPTGPDAAKEVVRKALDALKSGDQEAFRALLSAERSREFTEAWFQLWVSEVQPAQSWELGAFEGEGEGGRVRVALDLGRSKQDAPIRVRLEGGQWRWAER